MVNVTLESYSCCPGKKKAGFYSLPKFIDPQMYTVDVYDAKWGTSLTQEHASIVLMVYTELTPSQKILLIPSLSGLLLPFLASLFFPPFLQWSQMMNKLR